jgi:uncharacterized protein with NAD-binding domain and iron-sulfur cluster
MAEEKEKVVILGGGLAGVSTALFLTNPDNPKAKRYDITVYQLGWRLGGKCASGRNPEMGNRIEEHGLHLLLGFYENLFRMIRRTMAEWDIPPGHPWAAGPRSERWSMALSPSRFAPLVERKRDGTWSMWNLGFPELPDRPGDAAPPRDDLIDFLSSLEAWLETLQRMLARDEQPDASLHAWLSDPAQDEAACKRAEKRRAHRKLTPVSTGSIVFGVVRLLALGLKRRGLRGWRRRFRRLDESRQRSAEMVYVFLDLGSALFCGLLWNALRVYWGTLDVLDEYELREFLRKYGAEPASLESPLIDSLYDAAFATEGGTSLRQHENMAAGIAIRSFLNITLGYKGAPWWKMNAGMGDTVFTPAYEVLKKRGVQFKFFHCVRNVDLSADGRSVNNITIGLQAYTRDPKSGRRLPAGEYDPLVSCEVRRPDGSTFPDPLMAWPSKPKSEWLDSAEHLAVIDPRELEDPESALRDVESIPLSRGSDFHHVVLAVPIGVLPRICPKLLQANPKVKKMVENVATVRTAAYQVWLRSDLSGMGWRYQSPVLGNFVDPLNTWADMTHLLPMEGPQNGDHPKNVSYFAGTVPDDIPAREAVGYVTREAASLLNQLAQHFLPGARDPSKLGFDTRLKLSDYARANISWTDRYTQSLAGTTRYRLRAHETGLDNLYFAGDWTRNGFNVGAVEPTVMSGMQASNAISGHPPLRDVIRGGGP